MLIDWLIAPLLALVTTVLGVLPTDTTFSTYMTSIDTSAFTTTLGPYVQDAAYFLPMTELSVFAWIEIAFILPALVVFEIAQWCYRELPHVFGWGS